MKFRTQKREPLPFLPALALRATLLAVGILFQSRSPFCTASAFSLGAYRIPPRRPASHPISGALYRLTASLAKSAFSYLTPSNRGFFEVQCTVIRTSICAAFHGYNSRVFIGPDDNHGSPLCLVHFRLQQIAAARQVWRPLPRYFNSNTPTSSSPNRNWSALAASK